MEEEIKRLEKEIAKNMISKGLEVSLIQKVTGLSKEIIEKLKQE